MSEMRTVGEPILFFSWLQIVDSTSEAQVPLINLALWRLPLPPSS